MAEIKNIETKETPVVEAKAEPKKSEVRYTSPIRIKLDDAQKLEMTGLITREMEKIKTEYTAAGYFEHDVQSKATYQGDREKTDFPFDDASNRRILLTTLTTDIVVSKAKRQTLTANPVMLLEKEEEMPEQDLRNREDLLDFRLRNDIKLEDLDTIVYRMACLQGAAVVKVPFAHETEWQTFKDTYNPTLADIGRFEKDYEAELTNKDSEALKLWKRLKNGEIIETVSDQETIIKHAPKPYRVPLNKFFARLSIKDFSKHRVIAEEFDYTWPDIHARSTGRSPYYDSDAVEELKLKYTAGKDKEIDKPYDQRDYHICEAIVKIDLKNEGKYKRYVVTFDADTNIILRAIHYPYNHNKVFYIVYNALPRDDSWMGYAFYDRLKDVEEVMGAFTNSAINEFTASHSPVVLTDDTKFAGGRLTMTEDGIKVLKFEKGTQFVPMTFERSGADRIGFMAWIQGLGELITGVSAALMSGRETPQDPRAPASKTAMKLQESNARVEDMVMNLQKGDEALAEQVDKLYYQYPDNESDTVQYFRAGQEKKEIGRDVYTKKVRYVCHGSRLSFDRSIDLQIAMQTSQFLMQMFPEVMQDANARFELLNIILNSSQGSVERNKDTFLKPMKNIIDARKAIQEKFKEIKEKGQSTPEDEKQMSELMKAAQMTPPQQGAQ